MDLGNPDFTHNCFKIPQNAWRVMGRMVFAYKIGNKQSVVREWERVEWYFSR